MTINPKPQSAIEQVLLALLPGLALTLWVNTWGFLLQWFLCLSSAWALDALFSRRPLTQPKPLFGQPWLHDGSSTLTATLLALTLPPYTPAWLAILAISAALGSKALLGGQGRNPINPAMLGYSLMLLAFPALLANAAHVSGLNFSQTLQALLGQMPTLDGWSQATVLDSLKHNNRLTQDELFSQNPAFGYLAAHGSEWANLAFAAGGLYLLKKRIIQWYIPVGVLAGIGLMSLFFWHGSGSNSNGSPLFHWLAGATLLGAFFIATEPISAPQKKSAAVLFGLSIGGLTYFLRIGSIYPDGLAIAVVLMNIASPWLSQITARRSCP